MPFATSHAPRPSRRSLARCGAGAFATLASFLLLAPAVAQAASKTATSVSTGMNATLEGAQLTVSPGTRVSSTFLRSVQGHPAVVACVSGAQDLFELVDQETLMPSGAFDVGFVGGPTLWPASATTLTYTLSRDISERADGCVVGRNPATSATFAFNTVAGELLEEGLPLQRLALAHGAAKLIARGREDHRFPSARALARGIAAAEPQMEVDFARSVRRATRNDVVYVIGAGTSFKSVQLAYRQNDGQPVLLEGRRRGEPAVEEPSASLAVPDTDGDERRSPARR